MTADRPNIFNRCPECGGEPELLRYVSDRRGPLYTFHCFAAADCLIRFAVREQLSESAAHAEWRRVCTLTREQLNRRCMEEFDEALERAKRAAYFRALKREGRRVREVNAIRVFKRLREACDQPPPPSRPAPGLRTITEGNESNSEAAR